ncbi:MAG TPA: HEAT repeat domain-containing protein [Chthonomonadaceae bacterium]|nr:HEAT repeat domain-containing protein [Chthonomonadaceae bacterium]
MAKKLGWNKHQKAAHKTGEAHVGKAQVSELLEMACSEDAEERLEAARYLCPCHVRTRIPAVWETLYRLMQDPDPRVRRQSWHTIEDGGTPRDEASRAILEHRLRAETDPKVRKFAEEVFRKAVGPLPGTPTDADWLPARPVVKRRGKCDFCGQTDVEVDWDPETLIPTATDPRAALICEQCARTKRG